MTSSPRPQRQRNSMEQPVSISDVIDLKDELNRIHEEISPECLKHIEKMSGHIDEFEKDYQRASSLITGGKVAGTATAAAGVGLSVFTLGLSLFFGVLTGAALTAAIIAAVRDIKKKYKENNFRKNIETELEELQKKISPIIDLIEKIFNRIEEILRDPTLSEIKANAIRERFSHCFEKMQLLQGHDNRGVGGQMSKTMQFSGNLTETFADIRSVLDVLEEILESEFQESSDTPAEASRPKQIDKEEFKIKSEKFITVMKELIKQLKKVMSEINQTKERISHNLDKA